GPSLPRAHPSPDFGVVRIYRRAGVPALRPIDTLPYRYRLVSIRPRVGAVRIDESRHGLSSCTTTTTTVSKGAGMNPRPEPAQPEPGAIARPALKRELLLVAGLFLFYKLGRQLATGHSDIALDNAHRVWHLERASHLPGEGTVQSLLLHS